jgi:hypothetical protein
MGSSSEAFDLEEFKALRAEILLKVEAISKLEVIAVGGAAGVYGWLGTRTFAVPEEIWFLPVLFSLLGWVRAYFLGRQITVAGEYLLLLEKRLRPSCPVYEQVHGWEAHRREPAVEKKFIDRVTYVFWMVFFLITWAIPIIFGIR